MNVHLMGLEGVLVADLDPLGQGLLDHPAGQVTGNLSKVDLC